MSITVTGIVCTEKLAPIAETLFILCTDIPWTSHKVPVSEIPGHLLWQAVGRFCYHWNIVSMYGT